jgi:hypothetical protein
MEIEWFILAAGLICGMLGWLGGTLSTGKEFISFFNDVDQRLNGKIRHMLVARSFHDRDSRQMLNWMDEERKKNGS